MKRRGALLSVVAVMLVTWIGAGCGGSNTPAAAEATENAANTLAGTFSEPGVDAGNISVAFYSLKAAGGREDAPLAQAFTDAEGAYSLTLPDTVDVSTGKYLVVAFGSELARNVTGLTSQDVNPITEAVSDYIDNLLALGADINGLTVDVITALLGAAAGCDVNETAANITACLLANETFATTIANAFNGAPEMKTLASSPFAITGAVGGFNYDLNCNEPSPAAGDPTGFTFDMTADGEVSDGFNDSNSDAYDDVAELHIDSGDAFGADSIFPTRATGNQDEARLEDVDGDGTADQIVYLAKTDGGLDVVRKIYVPQTFDCTLGGTIAFQACGWARYLDCFSNNTGADVTLDVSFQSELGSDGDELPVGTSFDDDFTHAYYWSTKEDGSDPQVGIVVDGEGGEVMADLVGFGGEYNMNNYADQAIADGSRACYMYYHALGDRMDPDGDMMGLLRYLFDNSPRTGVLPAEDKDVRNFAPELYSMRSAPGSMPPNANVTITNATTSETETVIADQYGRFTSIVGCNAGETLNAVSAVGGVALSGTCS